MNKTTKKAGKIVEPIYIEGKGMCDMNTGKPLEERGNSYEIR